MYLLIGVLKSLSVTLCITAGLLFVLLDLQKLVIEKSFVIVGCGEGQINYAGIILGIML